MDIRHRFALLAIAAACAASARPAAQPAVQPPTSPDAGPRIAQAVSERLERGERVRVLVEVKRPAASLPSAASDVADAKLVQLQQDVMDRIPHYGAKRIGGTALVSMSIDAGALESLRQSSAVSRVNVDKLRKPNLTESVPLIGAPTAWSAGATGAGWAVAVLDTGVDKAHPFLAGKVISEACYSTEEAGDQATSLCPGGAPSSTASGSGVPCDASIAGCDHGTRVAGIAAGKGTSFSGVARDASIIAIKVYSRIDDPIFCAPDPAPCVGAYDGDVIEGLVRVYNLRTTYNIASALVALGGGEFATACDASSDYTGAISTLRTAGIATVTSSGNDGFANAMHEPACVSTAVSVGASLKSDVVASYTNTSAQLNLLAPGSLINSSIPGGTFDTGNGTSMAAAHVAGAWAAMKDLHPTLSVSSVLNIFKSTGKPINDGGVSRPRLNLGAAVGAGGGDNDPIRRELPNFDGSSTHDIFWKSTSGSSYSIWLMNAGAIGSTAVFGASSTWQVVGTGDHNGDGRSDILWHSPSTGAYAIWFMNGGTHVSSAVFSVGAGWSLVSDGDLNGDGRTDLLWRRSADGALAIWFMNGGSLLGSAVFGGAAGWDVVGLRDLNGDGRDDLLWRSQVNGTLAIWFMNGGTLLSTKTHAVGTTWNLVGAGDLNNDGKADLQWRHTTQGTLSIWFMNGGTLTSSQVFALGTEWLLKGTGNVNGTSGHDLLWRRNSDGFTVIWFMNGATLAGSTSFGVGTGWSPVEP